MSKKIYILLALGLMILFLGAVGMILLGGVSVGLAILVIPALSVGLFGWVLPIVLSRVSAKVWVFSGLLIFFGLLFPTSALISGYEAGPFSSLTGVILFLLPSLALVNAAFLLYAGISGIASPSSRGLKVLPLPLSVLLVVKTLHNLYELTLWDNTYDPLGYLWLIVPIFAALLSGLTLSVGLPGRGKMAGPAFSILVSVLMIGVSALAQRLDFRQETAKRAERTVRAVESYFEGKGSYPETLSQLTPWYILSIPGPMIIHGQDWCYQGGEGYYRLGYIDREHWSNPNLVGRKYKSVGEMSESQSICEDEFTALQSRHPKYPYSYSKDVTQ